MPPKSPSPNPPLTSCQGFDFSTCAGQPTHVVTWLDGRPIPLCAYCYNRGLAFFRSDLEAAKTRYRAYRTARVAKCNLNPRK